MQWFVLSQFITIIIKIMIIIIIIIIIINFILYSATVHNGVPKRTIINKDIHLYDIIYTANVEV